VLHVRWRITKVSALRGPRHHAYKHGRRSIAFRETRRLVRAIIREIERVIALSMHAQGLKPLRAIRRPVAVRKAIAEAEKRKQPDAATQGGQEGGQGADRRAEAEDAR
jgi:hypothetical protein